MNDLDLCLEVEAMSTICQPHVINVIASHSSLNISETVRDSGLVLKDKQ